LIDFIHQVLFMTNKRLSQKMMQFLNVSRIFFIKNDAYRILDRSPSKIAGLMSMIQFNCQVPVSEQLPFSRCRLKTLNIFKFLNFLYFLSMLSILNLWHTSAYAGSIHPADLKRPAPQAAKNLQNTSTTITTTNTKPASILIKDSKTLAEANIKDIKSAKTKEIKTPVQKLNTNTLNADDLAKHLQSRDQEDLKRAQALTDQDVNSSQTINLSNSSNQSSQIMMIPFKDVVFENKILAEVNNNMLTSNDIQNYIKNLKNQALANKIAWHEPRDKLDQIILPRLIIDKIQLQRARDIQLKIEAEQMNAIMENIARNQGINIQQMRDQFNQEGVDFAAYVNQTKEALILKQLQDIEFANKIMVFNHEIENYRKKHISLANNSPVIVQTKLRHIVLRKDLQKEKGDSLIIQKQLNDIRQKIIDKRQSFETMALLYSQDSTAAKGGYLGALFPEEMPLGLEEVIHKLPIAQISDVLETEHTYHILQVLDRQTVNIPVSDQNKLIESIITEKKTEAAYQNWLQKLIRSAYIRYKN
jgi:parvulin-like peptidyl-prolyl isomerase